MITTQDDKILAVLESKYGVLKIRDEASFNAARLIIDQIKKDLSVSTISDSLNKGETET